MMNGRPDPLFENHLVPVIWKGDGEMNVMTMQTIEHVDSAMPLVI